MHNIVSSQPPDSDLVEAVKDGDRNAEDLIYRRYKRVLVLMLKKRCGDEFLAEDLAQDTFAVY